MESIQKILLPFFFTFVFVLSGCGGGSSSTEEDTSTTLLDYAGAYHGVYSSDTSGDYGIWNIALFDDGSILGFGRHHSGVMFDIRGAFEASGDAIFDATAYGSTNLSATFEATISSDGLMSATWTSDTDSGTAAGSRVPSSSIDLADYWPLTLNHYRTYDVKSHTDVGWQYQEREQIIGTELIDGTEAVQQAYFDSDYGDGSMTVVLDYDLFSLTPVSIDILGSNVLVDAWDDGEILGYRMFVPPAEIPRIQTTGETQVARTTETYPDASTSDITISMTLLGFEAVSVNAGNFDDAAMFLIGYQKDDLTEYEIAWYVKDIGRVRSVDLEDLQELTDWGTDPLPCDICIE